MIARMKKYLAILLLLLAALMPAPRLHALAAQEGTYAVAVGQVWFYASADEPLFLLPESYYVRVLERGETYCTVEYLTDDAPYKKLFGYCRTDALTFVDFVPERPYLRKQITVTYTLPDAGGLGTEDFTTYERTFVYYGDRYEGEQLYLYVLSEDTFGYIPADAPPEFERNTDYLTSASGETETPSDTAPSVNAVQIVVIVLACVAAIAVAVILLRGKKPPREQQEF